MTHVTLRQEILIGALLVLPAAHPVLIPVIGAPSHLLWWLHVLPVALLAFRRGRSAAVAMVALSAVIVLVGERWFGAGYGVPATMETAVALTVALTGTHVLVAGFALYARTTTRRYQLLFENAALAILRTDAEGTILAANPAALALLGTDRRSALGARLGTDAPVAGLRGVHALAINSWSGELLIGDRGEARARHVTATALRHDDPPGFQVLLVDRTSEVVHDRELERQARLATLGGTLAAVAHELKNPVHVIAGFAELARQPATPAEREEASETIEAQASRMRALLEELLGFSREPEREAGVPVAEVVRQHVHLQSVTRPTGTRFRERIAWEGEALANRGRLEQILANLLANATDAVDGVDGIVEVEVRREGPSAVIDVADNGPGVPADLMSRIFEPFVTTKEAGRGTGLGLAISRRLAEGMGGTLTVANRPGGGAVFSLRLPIEPAVMPGVGRPVPAASRVA